MARSTTRRPTFSIACSSTERFEINAGLRYENNEASSTLANIAVPYPAPPADARRHAGAARREHRRPRLVPPRPRLQAERELEHLPRARQLGDAVAIVGERHLRRRDELQRRSRGSGDRRARRQVGAPGRSDVDGRGVPQRAQPVPRAVRRPDDPRAAARRQLARRRRRARRSRRDRHAVVDIRQLHVSRQRGLAVRIGSNLGRRRDRYSGRRPVAEHARALGEHLDDVPHIRCLLDRLRRDVSGRVHVRARRPRRRICTTRRIT